MFQIQIGGIHVLFVKAFQSEDRDGILQFARGLAGASDKRQILFVDTPATAFLIEAVQALLQEGCEVHFRDHHDLKGPGSNDRERITVAAYQQIRLLLGERAVTVTREQHPACSSLLNTGEFSDALCIVADPDSDGLTAAMKAVGLTYPSLDADSAILDGPRSGQMGGSEISRLLVKGFASVVPFTTNATLSLKQKAELFGDWVAATQGDETARGRLEQRVSKYEAGVAEARRLLASAQQVAGSVWLVNASGSKEYDLLTIASDLEGRGARVTVVIKGDGPIAKLSGVQYSLAVPVKVQKEVNLQSFLPEGFVSSPAAGIISNNTFLLHLSQQKWEEVVLPALVERFGAVS